MQPRLEFPFLDDWVVEEPFSAPNSFQVLLDLLPHHDLGGVDSPLLIGLLLNLRIFDFVGSVVVLHELDYF